MVKIKVNIKENQRTLTLVSFAIIVLMTSINAYQNIPHIRNNHFSSQKPASDNIGIDSTKHIGVESDHFIPTLIQKTGHQDNHFTYWTLAFGVFISIRVLVGLIFLYNDNTYEIARDKRSVEYKDWAQSVDFLFSIGLTMAALFLNNLIWHADFHLVIGIMIFISFLALLHDFIFRVDLFKLDSDKMGNRTIVFSDIISLIFSIGLLFDQFCVWRYAFSFSLMFLVIFILEIWSIYLDSLKIAFGTSITQCCRHLKLALKKPREVEHQSEKTSEVTGS